jgi:FkbM family methyltransferase
MSDPRTSLRVRRQSWFGLKSYVKRAASYPIPHAFLRLLTRFVPRLRSGRLPAPRDLMEVTGRIQGEAFVMLRPDRCEIAKELYWGHGKRPRPEDANALEIVARLVRDADVFFDIGAYTGLFTLATTAVNQTLTAHAFEIVPGVADLLRANIDRNQVGDRTAVHLEGIGVPGSTMVVPTGEGGSALPSFYSAKMHFMDGLPVTFRSLDSLDDLISADERIVMKIDVEGTEADIFKHGVRFLQEHGPDILCEVLYGQADALILNELLVPLGYQLYLIREHDTLLRPSISPDPHFRDWLFTRRSTFSG